MYTIFVVMHICSILLHLCQTFGHNTRAFLYIIAVQNAIVRYFANVCMDLLVLLVAAGPRSRIRVSDTFLRPLSKCQHRDCI